MDDEVGPAGSPPWDRYREYLVLLARVLVNPKLRPKLDSSDLVQEALLKAYQALPNYKGKSEPELRAWLREILLNTLKDRWRAIHGPKRDINLEHSLEQALERSSARLEEWLGDSADGPEAKLMKEELLDQIARAINQLPENQRTAVEYFHIHRCTVAEISQEMGLSKKAVAGLIERGVKAIRNKMRESS
jgi:RNA polymerase sigma-70 factor, ECF subfamily